MVLVASAQSAMPLIEKSPIGMAHRLPASCPDEDKLSLLDARTTTSQRPKSAPARSMAAVMGTVVEAGEAYAFARQALLHVPLHSPNVRFLASSMSDRVPSPRDGILGRSRNTRSTVISRIRWFP
jgi:hypothetical protein